jgi:hypothetical protein
LRISDCGSDGTNPEAGTRSATAAEENAPSNPPPALRNPPSNSARRFFALALWLCAAGSAILLLCPAAFNRRVLTLQIERAETEARRQFVRNADLERWREALESDPSVIESQARSDGYGRADQRPYPITAAEWKAARARLTAAPAAGEALSEPSAVGQAILPALMLILLGALAVLFFSDLKVPEPRRMRSASLRGEPGDRR